MASPESKSSEGQLALTWEQILGWTGFHLAEEYTGFAANDGEVSPELHEERERFSRLYGEDNVLTSFFVTGEGNLALGLFVRGVTDWDAVARLETPQ